MSRNRRHCDITKPVESVLGAHPNISLAVSEDIVYEIGREAIDGVEYIGPTLVYVQQALPAADPQTPVGAPKEPSRRKLACGARKCISVDSSFHELFKPVVRTKKECAIVIF